MTGSSTVSRHRCARRRSWLGAVAASLAAFALAPAAPRSAAATDPVDARADAVVAEVMREHRIPGVALGVVQDGRLIKARGYGYANLEWKIPVAADSMFQSGSVAKQFTATGVMMLVEAGKVALDDPISTYLPESAAASWHAVTVRQLLTHTSGVPDIFNEDDATSYGKGILDFRRDYTEDELLHRYLALKLDFPPGDQYRYSNTGYELLGFLIHRVTGRFYGDFLAERIFEPLGMTSTRIISEEAIVPHRVAGYRIVDGRLENQEWIAPSLNTTADGGLYVNVPDLAKWDAALYGDRVLPQSALRQMWTPVRLNSGKTYPYGFGWDVDVENGHPLISHTGSNQGFAISISRYVRDRLTVIVLTNLDSTHSETLGIARRVAPLYFPAGRTPAKSGIVGTP
jgi:CubicO group peptidase (beta-lactamase class C family)